MLKKSTRWIPPQIKNLNLKLTSKRSLSFFLPLSLFKPQRKQVRCHGGIFKTLVFFFHSHLTCRVGPPLVAGIYMHPVTPILWRSRKRYQPDQSAPSAATWPQTPEFVCLFVFLSVTTCEHLPSPLDRNRINSRYCLQLDSCVTWWGMQFVPKWDGKQSTSGIAKKDFSCALRFNLSGCFWSHFSALWKSSCRDMKLTQVIIQIMSHSNEAD